MHIAFHIGAHVTDGERLLKSLLKNADALAGQGVCVPTPGLYRKPVREAIQAWAGGAPIAADRSRLFDALPGAAAAERLVLCNPAFLCTPTKVFDDGEFYGIAALKVRALAALFPDDQVELFLATRNPATFVPAVWAQSRSTSVESYLGGLAPLDLRWSDVVGRIRAAAPEIGLTIWCNEDTPLIWGRILRRLAGVDGSVTLLGEHDLLATIMSGEGLERFLAYLQSHPPASEAQMGRVIAAFLGKYALEDEIEEDVEVPGWDEALVDEITNAYEVDIARMGAMEGVRFLAP